ncbi:NPCBM/NEW2 domain-containing protein, partial [uncultured Duncaniella sp.]|uniref:NPCBM/NEW2 domain-containing protein n=1 Tax=uncultured Duncaniella sp. TaxID=2768039 RepID=UPI0034A3287B
GSTTIIKKGIWAHATSTLEYDISSYKDYAYFTTYYGINTTSGNKGNGVKFYIYTSEDGKNWTLCTEENPTAIKSSNNAVYVKIDIRDANYIRLYANDNGSNASDHAVWGDAKLVKEGYNDNV